MAGSTELDIDYVAALARIALSAEERERFGRQLAEVLAYMEELREVDVTGVEPMAHAMVVENVWEEDVARPGLPAGTVGRMAPQARDDMVVVPVVVGESA